MPTRRTREQWAALIAKFERGEKPASDFCSQRGIRAKTFAWWRWRLRLGETSGGRRRLDAGVRLLSVDVRDDVATNTSRTVVIVFSGIELRVDSSLSVDYVATLVTRLRRT
jgi:hypothetical protein